MPKSEGSLLPPPPIPTALYGRNALVERLLFLAKGSSSPFPPFTLLFLLPFVKCQENYPENLRKYSFAKFAAFRCSQKGVTRISMLHQFMKEINHSSVTFAFIAVPEKVNLVTLSIVIIN